MSELFSIQLQNRQKQGRDGVWLDLPTTTEQVTSGPAANRHFVR